MEIYVECEHGGHQFEKPDFDKVFWPLIEVDTNILGKLFDHNKPGAITPEKLKQLLGRLTDFLRGNMSICQNPKVLEQKIIKAQGKRAVVTCHGTDYFVKEKGLQPFNIGAFNDQHPDLKVKVLSTVISGKSAPAHLTDKQKIMYEKGCIHSVEEELVASDDTVPELTLFLK